MTLDVDDIMSDPSSTSSESSFSSDASIEDNLADLDAKRDAEEEPDDVADDDPGEASENSGKKNSLDEEFSSIWQCTSSMRSLCKVSTGWPIFLQLSLMLPSCLQN